MKTPRIINSVGHIDDDLITAATENKKKSKFSPWLKWGSIAACFAVIVIAGKALLQSLLKKKEDPKKEEEPKKSEEVLLLEEIRDLLKNKNK